MELLFLLDSVTQAIRQPGNTDDTKLVAVVEKVLKELYLDGEL